MATNHFNAEKAFVPAIGRELDPAYLKHIGKVARRILPATIELKLRKQVGVSYVTEDKLASKKRLEADNDDERLSLLQQYARSTVQSLSDQGNLDSQAAHEGLNVTLEKPDSVWIKRRGARNVILVLSVLDVLFTSNGEETYQIEAERDGYAGRFSMRSVPSGREIPRHNLRLGSISDNVLPSHLDQIGRALEEPIPLLGIGGFNSTLLQS
jgi:hypothetical protein